MRNRGQLRGQPGIAISKEIGGGVRRGSHDDRIGPDRTAFQPNGKSGARWCHGHGRVAADEDNPTVSEALLQRGDQRVETAGGGEERGPRRRDWY
jgi:hypothetical protein